MVKNNGKAGRKKHTPVPVISYSLADLQKDHQVPWEGLTPRDIAMIHSHAKTVQPCLIHATSGRVTVITPGKFDGIVNYYRMQEKQLASILESKNPSGSLSAVAGKTIHFWFWFHTPEKEWMWPSFASLPDKPTKFDPTWMTAMRLIECKVSIRGLLRMEKEGCRIPSELHAGFQAAKQLTMDLSFYSWGPTLYQYWADLIQARPELVVNVPWSLRWAESQSIIAGMVKEKSIIFTELEGGLGHVATPAPTPSGAVWRRPDVKSARPNRAANPVPEVAPKREAASTPAATSKTEAPTNGKEEVDGGQAPPTPPVAPKTTQPVVDSRRSEDDEVSSQRGQMEKDDDSSKGKEQKPVKEPQATPPAETEVDDISEDSQWFYAALDQLSEEAFQRRAASATSNEDVSLGKGQYASAYIPAPAAASDQGPAKAPTPDPPKRGPVAPSDTAQRLLDVRIDSQWADAQAQVAHGRIVRETMPEFGPVVMRPSRTAKLEDIYISVNNPAHEIANLILGVFGCTWLPHAYLNPDRKFQGARFMSVFPDNQLQRVGMSQAKVPLTIWQKLGWTTKRIRCKSMEVPWVPEQLAASWTPPDLDGRAQQVRVGPITRAACYAFSYYTIFGVKPCCAPMHGKAMSGVVCDGKCKRKVMYRRAMCVSISALYEILAVNAELTLDPLVAYERMERKMNILTTVGMDLQETMLFNSEGEIVHPRSDTLFAAFCIWCAKADGGRLFPKAQAPVGRVSGQAEESSFATVYRH